MLDEYPDTGDRQAVATRIRVVVVHKERLIRAGLRTMLEEGARFVIAGETGDCREAAEILGRERPDVVILCLTGFERAELGQLAATIEGSGDTRLLLLASPDGPNLAEEIVRLGAVGLVITSSHVEMLTKAVERIHDGEVWIDRAIITNVLAEIRRPSEQRAGQPDGPFAVLTARELEVVRLVAEGLKNREIAERLFISDVTVRHHLTSVFGKLGVATRQQLMIYAFSHQLAPSPEGRAALR